MHCMSDEYLAEELEEEMNLKDRQKKEKRWTVCLQS